MEKRELELDLEVKADSRYKFNRNKVRAGVLDLLKDQGIKGRVEVSLSVVGERKIRELEKKYFGEEKVTDVLSFPQLDHAGIDEAGRAGGKDVIGDRLVLGDVVVCYPQAKRQSIKLNRLIDDEIEFLTCHGVLHLLGIHHD